MSLYNYIEAQLDCPSCERHVRIDVQARFGHANFHVYRVGDRVRWFDRRAVHNGGRPPAGDLSVEAAAHCPTCDATLTLTVEIRGDVIHGLSDVRQQCADSEMD